MHLRFFLAIIIFQIIVSHEVCHAQQTFARTYVGQRQDLAYDMVETTDGNFVIAGSTNSFGSDSTDILITKIDTTGNIIWTKTFGGFDDDYTNSVALTSDGGFIIGGSTESYGSGSADVLLIRTDSSGNLLWSKTYGNIQNEGCMDIHQTFDDGFIVMGLTSGYGDAYTQPFLMKTNNIGDTLWTKVYNTSSGVEVCYSIQITNDTGYILAGWSLPYMSADHVILVLKTNDNGTPVWIQNIVFCDGSHGSGPPDDVAYAIDQTSDGGFILAGSSYGCTYSGACLIKLDNDGSFAWSQKYHASGISLTLHSIEETINGDYLVSGYIDSIGVEDPNAIIIRTDSDGNLKWVREIGTVENTEDINTIKSQSLNSIYALGLSHEDYYNFDYSDFFILKTDSSGNIGCSETIPSIQVNSATPVFGGAAVSYNYFLHPNFILGNPNTQIGSGSFQSYSCLDNVNEFLKNSSITIYPNPVINNCNVELEKMIHHGNLQIINSIGQVIYEEVLINTSKKEIDLTNLPKGLYLVRITEENNSSGSLLIKE